MRLLRLLPLLLLLAVPVEAATYYVDATCPTAGNGTSSTCLSSPTTNNPKTNLDTTLAAATCGDIINVRGVHALHGACPGFDGKYYAPTDDGAFNISGKSCSGNPGILQANGWTSVGTGETTYMLGMWAPDHTVADCSGTCGWSQCAASCGTACQGTTFHGGVGTDCDSIWYTTNVAALTNVYAFKDDMSPTFPVTTAASLTNSNGAYMGGACNIETWRRCHTGNPLGANVECPAAGDACGGTSPEVDSWRDGSNRLFVQWGTGANAPGGANRKRPFIANTAGDSEIFFVGYPAQTIGWTVRGFTLLGGKTPAILARVDNPGTGAPSQIVFQDFRIFYVIDQGGGASYGVQAFRAGALTLQDFEIAYTSSEGFHSDPRASAAAMVLTFNRGWIHHIGDQGVVGAWSGTAAGMIIGGNDGVNPCDGNYTGSVFDSLLVDQINPTGAGASPAHGIIWETCASNVTLSNSVIYKPDGACGFFDGVSATGATNGNVVYNNLCITPVRGKFSRAWYFVGTTGGGLTNTLFWSNTTYTTGSIVGAGDDSGSHVASGNVYKDNIWATGANKCFDFSNITGANTFDFNLCQTSANPAVTFPIAGTPTNKSCALLSDFGAGNINNCPDPLFVSTGSLNFHIQTSSPAKDAGTATGMPAGRTTDICNPIASLHGLPSYNDCQAASGTVDIGADEFVAAGGATQSGCLGKIIRSPAGMICSHRWPYSFRRAP